MKNLFRTMISIAGFAIGPGIVVAVYSIINTYFDVDLNNALLGWVNMGIYIVSAIVSGIIFIIFSKKIVDDFINMTSKLESDVDKVPARTVYMTLIGLIGGIVIAFTISWL